MYFPVAFLHEGEAGYSVAVPDIPGVFTAGDTLEEALLNVEEAVEAIAEDLKEMPTPFPLEFWRNHPEWADWDWVLLNLDTRLFQPKYVRVTITVPEHLLEMIDKAAAGAGTSRSNFLVQAATARAKAAEVQG